VDRVAFWVAPTGRSIAGWFHASLYDTPFFLCYLSVVPSLAIFLVSVETDFYDRYREYYGVATKQGTLRQVLEAKRAMTECRVVQGPLILLLMVLAPWIAAELGLYFDRRRAAAEVAGVFLAANLLLTVITLLVGPRSYGLGCAWAYHRLEQTLDDLEYLTFAAQPMAPEASAVESSPPAFA